MSGLSRIINYYKPSKPGTGILNLAKWASTRALLSPSCVATESTFKNNCLTYANRSWTAGFQNTAPWPCFRAFPPVCWNTLKQDIYNTYIHINIGEGNSSPLQYTCLETPMDSIPWWATAHGVGKGWTQLRNWAHIQIYGKRKKGVGGRAALQHDSRRYCSHLFSTEGIPWRCAGWQDCGYRTVRHQLEGIGVPEWRLMKEPMTWSYIVLIWDYLQVFGNSVIY